MKTNSFKFYTFKGFGGSPDVVEEDLDVPTGGLKNLKVQSIRHNLSSRSVQVLRVQSIQNKLSVK